MNHQKPIASVRKLKWQVFGIILIIISVLVVYFYFVHDASLSNSIWGWLIANLIAGGTIYHAYTHIEKLQAALNHKINLLETEAQIAGLEF